MQKALKWIAAVAATAMVMLLLCSCSGSAVAGIWYLADDVDGETPLTLTSDGKFNWDDLGGEYSYENGQVVLVSSWVSTTLNAEKIGGKNCLVDEDGGIWFKSRAAAQNYYEKETAKRCSAVESLCYGTYSYDRDWFENEEITLTLNKNHTYECVFKGRLDSKHTIVYYAGGGSALYGKNSDFNATQTGTWSMGYEGTLLNGRVCIKVTPEQSDGYDNASVDDYHDWIEKNTPAPPLRSIKVNEDGGEILNSWIKE